MAATGYVVTRPYPGSGVGSNLLSLAGAVWLGRALGRAVLVDWRATAFLKDKSLNYFPEFFEPVPEIQGVPILYAPSPEAGDDRSAPPGESRELGISECREVARTGSQERYLVVRSYHGVERLDPRGDPADRFWATRDFYGFIRPRAFVADEVDRWYDAHLKGSFVVGVNISTGNGEFAKGQAYYGRVDLGIFANEKRFLKVMEKAGRLATRGLPPFLRTGAKVFFSTDCYPMHGLLSRIPRAVTRRTVFPPPGLGRVFCDYEHFGHSDREAAIDTIVDMLLLARCDALIRNYSVFNHYAQVVSGYFNGNVRDIEPFFARYWLRAVANRLRRMVRSPAGPRPT